MAHGFDTPIRDIIRDGSIGAYVLLAGIRLKKAVRKGPFPVAYVDDVHPTFVGLRDDPASLAVLAEAAGLELRSKDGAAWIVPAGANYPPGPFRAPPPPAQARPQPDKVVSKPAPKTFAPRRVVVTDKVVLDWTAPVAKGEGDRPFTLRPGPNRYPKAGLPRTAARVVALLQFGLPHTPKALSSALGISQGKIEESLNDLIARRIVVDAGEPHAAHGRSDRWLRICTAVLALVPRDGWVGITTIARKLKDMAGESEIRRAVGFLEARGRIHPADTPTRFSASPGMDERKARELAAAKARRMQPPQARLVTDPDVLDWTAPILSPADTRRFVAYPVIESESVADLPPEAIDVLELLRDYVPRDAGSIAVCLGIDAEEARDHLNRLVERGLVLDGAPPEEASRNALEWQRCCHEILLHCRGTAPPDPAELPDEVRAACGQGAGHAVRYLVERGLLSPRKA